MPDPDGCMHECCGMHAWSLKPTSAEAHPEGLELSGLEQMDWLLQWDYSLADKSKAKIKQPI